MLHRLQGTITALENGTAALELEDGQVLTLPLRDLNPRPQVGDPYTVTVEPEAEDTLATDDLARTLLSQLIIDVPPASQKIIAEAKIRGDQANGD